MKPSQKFLDAQAVAHVERSVPHSHPSNKTSFGMVTIATIFFIVATAAVMWFSGSGPFNRFKVIGQTNHITRDSVSYTVPPAWLLSESNGANEIGVINADFKETVFVD